MQPQNQRASYNGGGLGDLTLARIIFASVRSEALDVQSWTCSTGTL